MSVQFLVSFQVVFGPLMLIGWVLMSCDVFIYGNFRLPTVWWICFSSPACTRFLGRIDFVIFITLKLCACIYIYSNNVIVCWSVINHWWPLSTPWEKAVIMNTHLPTSCLYIWLTGANVVNIGLMLSCPFQSTSVLALLWLLNLTSGIGPKQWLS